MVTVSDFNKGKAGGNVGARRRSKPTGSPGYTPPSVRKEQSKKKGHTKHLPLVAKLQKVKALVYQQAQAQAHKITQY